MKVYRGVLITILILAVCAAVWYCLSVYWDQRSTERGILVWEETDAAAGIY